MREVPPGQSVTALYFMVANHSDEPCRLTSVTVAGVGRAELHRTMSEGGMARMRRQDALEIPAGGQVQLAPGADHVMLFDVERHLGSGDAVQATLDFGGCGLVSLEARVSDLAGASDSSRHHPH